MREYDELKITDNNQVLKRLKKSSEVNKGKMSCNLCPPNKKENANRRDNSRKHTKNINKKKGKI